MSGMYDRPSDIPKLHCSACGGEHRPEAVAINVAGERHDRYIAGHVTCPALATFAADGQLVPGWTEVRNDTGDVVGIYRMPESPS